jgi:predicted nuclease with TOPRIM domain
MALHGIDKGGGSHLLPMLGFFTIFVFGLILLLYPNSETADSKFTEQDLKKALNDTNSKVTLLEKELAINEAKMTMGSQPSAELKELRTQNAILALKLDFATVEKNRLLAHLKALEKQIEISKVKPKTATNVDLATKLVDLLNKIFVVLSTIFSGLMFLYQWRKSKQEA